MKKQFTIDGFVILTRTKFYNRLLAANYDLYNKKFLLYEKYFLRCHIISEEGNGNDDICLKDQNHLRDCNVHHSFEITGILGSFIGSSSSIYNVRKKKTQVL